MTRPVASKMRCNKRQLQSVKHVHSREYSIRLVKSDHNVAIAYTVPNCLRPSHKPIIALDGCIVHGSPQMNLFTRSQIQRYYHITSITYSYGTVQLTSTRICKKYTI